MANKRVNVMRITKRFVIGATSLVLALYTCGVFDEAVLSALRVDPWSYVLSSYAVPFGQYCITTLYIIYIRFTVTNVLVFITKYLPTGIYLYMFLNDVCRTSRENLKTKGIEVEDIELQIAIVKTKQCVGEAECAECAAQLQRAAAQVRAMRARVRDLAAADDVLQPLLERFSSARHANLIDQLDHHWWCDTSDDINLMELLARDNNEIAERVDERVDESGEGEPREGTYPVSEKSDKSARSETDVEKDCQIKIIKVTNVYKVAYLKHYIKQKRMRRASRQALLKTKMENIKLLLENWQKSLNLVVKDQYMLETRRRDEMSEETGDTILRGSDTDTALDEYNPAWDHQPDPGQHYYKEPDIAPSQEDFECQEYGNYCGNYYEDIDMSVYEELETKYEGSAQCASARLPRLLEETSSQLLATQDLSMSDHNDSNEHMLAV